MAKKVSFNNLLFSRMREPLSILKKYWGYDAFRPLQDEIIQSVLDSNDTLALMPTGGGKSLCYQVPALAKDGLCLVISPLIALMKDQVENLKQKGIPALSIYSGMSFAEVRQALNNAMHGNFKFLYVSPERLETSLFLEYLPGIDVNLIAVDEAHCISQWGYDFRPSYLKIANLRDELGGVPVLALTASATADVQKDICTQLHFKNENVFRQSFARPNLSYSALQVESKSNKLLDVLRKVPGCGIVYCKSRKLTKDIASLLQLNKLSADFYHAGLSANERNEKQERWISNKIRIMVCTNAFGMGIDKPDVRVVVHHEPPDCLENYYQEAGRAGRDGKKSYAVLLFKENDLETLRSLSEVRYPGFEAVKSVYRALVNYLQVPSGSSEGEYFDFDLNDFLKRFKLNSLQVIYSLKMLEQDGYISFNEQIFLPATVVFTCSKEQLYEFENNNPQVEELIKSLLRTYEGIFDYPAGISEKQLARLNKKTEPEIRNALKLLNQSGIIQYLEQKDTPQIRFLSPRVPVENLAINTRLHNKRKGLFEKRVLEMIHYTDEKTLCRSRIIGAYFGDTALNDCGICDNCLNRKKNSVSVEEFTRIRSDIFARINNGMVVPEKIFADLGSRSKEKYREVIDFLVAEERIRMDKDGNISIV